MQNLVDEYKTIFWECGANFGSLQKLSPDIGVAYKLVLKCFETWKWMFWAMKYWFKSLECQTWSTNTKPFFWESEKNLGTFQNLSRYIIVAYKFVLKCVRNLSCLWFSFFQMLCMLNVQLWNIQLEIYLFIYFQFIYRWQILFHRTIRLAFHKQQGLSQTSGAINNIVECCYRWHQIFETEPQFVVLIKVNTNVR